jgi:PKD repeat protein
MFGRGETGFFFEVNEKGSIGCLNFLSELLVWIFWISEFLNTDNGDVNVKKNTLRLSTMALALSAALASPAMAQTSQVRVTWTDTPSNNITIGFTAKGSDAHVKYGTSTDETTWTRANLTRSNTFKTSIVSQIVKLTGLTPNTAYYMQACDSTGCGQRYWFKTASDRPQDMTFISGGDSRSNPTGLQKANRMVAKIRPSFVDFGGDLTNSHTVAEVNTWLTDWELAFSADTINGVSYKYIPGLIVNVGNHESSDKQFVCSIFGANTDGNEACSDRDTYGAFNVNGNQLRVYNLNSEFRPGGSTANATTMAAQTAWLNNDLATAGQQVQWRMAAYHVPALPRTSSKGVVEPGVIDWGKSFYTNKMNFVFESDSHLLKITKPVKVNAAGNDYEEINGGTVYLGEGAWATSPRAVDRNATWLVQDQYAQVNNFHLMQFVGDKLHVRTVLPMNEALVTPLTREQREANPLALPSNLSVRQFSGSDAWILGQDAAGRTTSSSTPPLVKCVPSVSAIASVRVKSAANLPVSVTLSGSATSATENAPLTTSWTAAPAGSTIAAPSALTTTASISAAGTHTFTLTCTDKAGSASKSSSTTVTVNKAPVANFTASSSALTATFTDSSSDDVSIASRSWNYGDGMTGTAASHTYAAAGTYNVSLTVTDNEGVATTVTKAVSIAVAPPADTTAPIANFTSTATELTASFADTSSDNVGVVSYAWNFGDGSTSTAKNPSHTYAADGTYNVSLIVKDAAGNASVAKTAAVTVKKTVVTPPNGDPVVLQQNTSGGNKMDVKTGQAGAQTFKHGTAGTFTATKLVLRVSRDASAPNANLNVFIGTSNQGGEIAGTRVAITPAMITNTSAGSTFQDVTINLDNIVLNQGTTYYINTSNTSSNGKAYYLEMAGSSTYANGTYYKASSDEKKDVRFAIWGK